MSIEDQIALVAKINEATKDIPDEETRKLAFRSLLTSAGLAAPSAAAKATAFVDQSITEGEGTVNDVRKVKRSRGASAKGAPAIDPELNLEPDGRQTFGEFVKKRVLKSKIDQISAAIYYLREVLKLEKVGEQQAATCFKDQGWDWPSDFRNTISQGKRDKRFHYDGFDDIKLTAVETNSIKKENAPSDVGA
jgi:hypothetical protein